MPNEDKIEKARKPRAKKPALAPLEKGRPVDEEPKRKRKPRKAKADKPKRRRRKPSVDTEREARISYRGQNMLLTVTVETSVLPNSMLYKVATRPPSTDEDDPTPPVDLKDILDRHITSAVDDILRGFAGRQSGFQPSGFRVRFV